MDDIKIVCLDKLKKKINATSKYINIVYYNEYEKWKTFNTNLKG